MGCWWYKLPSSLSTELDNCWILFGGQSTLAGAGAEAATVGGGFFGAIMIVDGCGFLNFNFFCKSSAPASFFDFKLAILVSLAIWDRVLIIPALELAALLWSFNIAEWDGCNCSRLRPAPSFHCCLLQMIRFLELIWIVSWILMISCYSTFWIVPPTVAPKKLVSSFLQETFIDRSRSVAKKIAHETHSILPQLDLI